MAESRVFWYANYFDRFFCFFISSSILIALIVSDDNIYIYICYLSSPITFLQSVDFPVAGIVIGTSTITFFFKVAILLTPSTFSYILSDLFSAFYYFYFLSSFYKISAISALPISWRTIFLKVYLSTFSFWISFKKEINLLWKNLVIAFYWSSQN